MMHEDHPLRSVVNGWIGKIDRAKKAKKPFSKTAKECMHFYAGDAGFMWKDAYTKDYGLSDKNQGAVNPRFQLTINKAFEFVAIYAPTLYDSNPVRQVNPREAMEFPPELFGDPNDPQVQQLIQQIAQQEQLRAIEDQTRARLMEEWLNYTPNEMPNGGLREQSAQAINEALIKGRGLLWTEPYQYPGSDLLMAVSTWESVDHLLIDPDAETLEFDSCKYIIRRKLMPIWQAERDFDLKKDDLKGKGTHESAESQGGNAASRERGGEYVNDDQHKYDLIEIFYIYSVAGTGHRLYDINEETSEALDDLVGDYAYLVISRNVPYPLNFNDDPEEFSDEEVAEAFSWPVPYWTDGRWPCSMLDFYWEPRNIWPVAPLKSGLGELKFINTMVSHLCSRIWMSSRDFIVIAKSAAADLLKTIEEGRDLSVLQLGSNIDQDINKVVSFLQQPQTNFDVWKILDAVMELFDKRVGLTELAYSLNAGGTQSRTAEDASNKRQAAQVRPDYMARRVEDWATEVARREAMCTRFFVEPQDVEPKMGRIAAELWGKLVLDTDVNKVVRELEYRIEAGSARKPNKDRDVANANQAINIFASEFSNYAQLTGDSGPLNQLIAFWGKAADSPLEHIQLGPMQPPPPPPGTPDPAQLEMQAKQQEMQLDAQKAQQDMQIAQQKLQLEITKIQASLAGDQQKAQISIELDNRKAQLQAAIDQRQSNQELRQDEQVHDQEMRQDQEQHQQELVQGRAALLANLQKVSQESDAKVKAAGAQRAASNGASK